MRKMASIRSIDNIEPITGADSIEVATVGGWKVVVKKGEFKTNDLVVYLEIDSWVPTSLAPFLSKGKEPKVFNGVEGERLQTVKLRGQISQGLLLPIDCTTISDGEGNVISVSEGDDVTEFLGIKKWERPLPTQLQGQAKGNFPSFIRKTDQERCQNLQKNIFVDWKDLEWEISLKLDGSSLTGYYNNGETGICSRNLELMDNDENSGNSFIQTFNSSGLKDAIKSIGRNVAVQGEMMGEKIQGNRENLTGTILFIFDVFDIDNQQYMTPQDRLEFINLLFKNGYTGDIAPILNSKTTLHNIGISNITDLLSFADGESINNPVREGVVFKCVTNGDISFKAISNKFLLKGGD